jgi:hypothetical protein
VLDHIAASFLTLAAFFRALDHRFVVRVFFAFFAALGAGFCAGTANHVCESPVPGNNVRGSSAYVSTILARLQRFHVLFLTFREHHGAMVGTLIALTLAVRASFRAFLERVFVFVLAIIGTSLRLHCSQGNSRNSSDSKFSSSDHANLLTCRNLGTKKP